MGSTQQQFEFKLTLRMREGIIDGDKAVMGYLFQLVYDAVRKKVPEEWCDSLLQESMIVFREQFIRDPAKYPDGETIKAFLIEKTVAFYQKKKEEMELDQRVIACLLNNDGWAYYYMQRRYFPAVSAMVLHYGGTEEDAKDVIMEGIYALIKNIQAKRYEIRAGVRLKSYFLKICKNIWMDKMKSKAFRKQVLLPVDEILRKHQEYPDELLEEEVLTERQRFIEQLLLHSGGKCKELLKAYYYEGLSHEEIARKLGYANANSSKTQKLKCINKLRAIVRKKFRNLSV
jgi:RNA polymerase sigma factor (sigma-70 family)